MNPKPDSEKKESEPRFGQRSALSLYMQEVKSFGRLEADEEQEIRDGLASGDPNARRRLVCSHLGFVVKVATEYRGIGLAFEDLLSEGNVGLLEAARRFDGDRGTRFTTYAIWWIRKAILSAISGKSSLIRSPAGKQRRLRQIRDAGYELRRTLGREPSREEISHHLSSSSREVDRLLHHHTSVVSLDQPVSDDGAIRIEHRLEDDRARSPEQVVLDVELGGNLLDALDALTERERLVVERRFGLDGEPPESLNEIGLRIGLSRERVRQIEAQARARLQDELKRRHAFGRAGDRVPRGKSRPIG